MARQCHLNSCPTGIATQREELRAKFRGNPEQVIAYFEQVGEDVRQQLAWLGVRSFDEIVGRADLLQRVDHPELPRSAMLDLSLLLTPATRAGSATRRTVVRNVRPDVISLDEKILEDAREPLEHGRPFTGTYEVENHHLAVGARVAGWLAERVGDEGYPDGHLTLRLKGSAGQSFGAFALHGMQLELEGEANDYVGKGLTGGDIGIRPFRNAHVSWRRPI